MAKAKRWALSVPIDGFALPEHADLAREAERLGYTDAWSYEADGLDCFASLAPVALATGMRLGTAIANVFTRGPATLAMSAATVADLAPGRFILGIGAGSQPIVESWNGGHFALPATRVREMVQVVRAALVRRARGVSWQGAHRRRLSPRAPPRGARADLRRRAAARHAARGGRSRRRRDPELAVRRRRPRRGSYRARGGGRGRSRSGLDRDHRAPARQRRSAGPAGRRRACVVT